MCNSEHHQTFSISCYLLADVNVVRAVDDGTYAKCSQQF